MNEKQTALLHLKSSVPCAFGLDYEIVFHTVGNKPIEVLACRDAVIDRGGEKFLKVQINEQVDADSVRISLDLDACQTAASFNGAVVCKNELILE